MRNLKRVLALALALVMVIGMMVMGTSAASYTDAADISAEYVEAVDVMTGVGMFEGEDDGSFAPAEVLTRAHAAALLARLTLGEKTADKLIATKQIFTDVATTAWYAPYVEYCYQAGLIDGLGDGTFNPGGELTGIAFAKLILVAMGYDADAQGYVGKDWAANIAVDALTNGLTVDGVVLSEKVTREVAAQMLFQALEKNTVKYTTAYDKATGAPVLVYQGKNVDETFASKYFDGLTKVEGIITDTDIDYGTTKITTEVDKKAVVVTLSNTAADWTTVGYAARAWYLDGVKADVALSVVVTGQDLYVYTDGTDVATLTNKSPLNPYYVVSAIKDYATVCNGVYGAKIVEKVGAKNALVDNDGDGIVDTVVCTTYDVAKVVNVQKASYNGTVSNLWYTLDNGKTVFYNELANVEALKKFSTIAYTVVDGYYYVTELASAEGEFEYIDSTWLTTEAVKSYSIAGVEYVESEMNGVNHFTKAGKNLLAKTNINNDVVYVVDMYGYLVRVEEPKADPDSYLYVFDNEHNKVLTGLAETLVAYTDGTVELVNVKKYVAHSALKNQIFTYEVKNGAYILGDAVYTEVAVDAYNTYEVAMDGIGIVADTVIVDLRDVIAGKAENGTVYTGYTEIPSFVDGKILYIPEIDLGFMLDGKSPAAAGSAITYVVFNTAANIIDRVNVGTAFAPNYVNTYALKAGVLIKGELVTDYVLSQKEKNNIDTFGVGVYSYAKDGTLTYTSFAENTDVQWTPASNGTFIYKGVDVTASGAYDIIILDIDKGTLGSWYQLVQPGAYYSWIDATNKIMYVVGDATVTKNANDVLWTDILAPAGAAGTGAVNGANEYWPGAKLVTAYEKVKVVPTYTIVVNNYVTGMDFDLAGATLVKKENDTAIYTAVAGNYDLNVKTLIGYEAAEYYVTDDKAIVDESSVADRYIIKVDGNAIVEIVGDDLAEIEYTLEYDYAGGSVATANPTKYTVNNKAAVLASIKAPTKAGYTLTSWTSAETATGLKYTATWEAKEYTLTVKYFNAAGQLVNTWNTTEKSGTEYVVALDGIAKIDGKFYDAAAGYPVAIVDKDVVVEVYYAPAALNYTEADGTLVWGNTPNRFYGELQVGSTTTSLTTVVATVYSGDKALGEVKLNTSVTNQSNAAGGLAVYVVTSGNGGSSYTQDWRPAYNDMPTHVTVYVDGATYTMSFTEYVYSGANIAGQTNLTAATWNTIFGK